MWSEGGLNTIPVPKVGTNGWTKEDKERMGQGREEKGREGKRERVEGREERG